MSSDLTPEDVYEFMSAVGHFICSIYGTVLIFGVGGGFLFYNFVYLTNQDYFLGGGFVADLPYFIFASLVIGLAVFGVVKLWRYVSRLRSDKRRICAFLLEAEILLKCNDFAKLKHERALLVQNLRLSPNAYMSEVNEAVGRLGQKEATLKAAIDEVEEAKRRQQQGQRDALLDKIGQVYSAFREQGHTEIIPEECKDYPASIIEDAKKWFDKYQDEERGRKRQEEWEREEYKEALLFISNNHGLPTYYAQLSNARKAFYDEALKLYKEGLLQGALAELRDQNIKEKPQAYITNQDYTDLAGGVEAGKEREKQLLTKKFYFETELGNGEQRFLKSFHKYETCKVSNFGDGFLHALFRKEGQNEGTQHFCTKHLFAKLHPGAQVEVRDWWKNEVDVVFKKGQKKLALEIETGSNKADYVRDKISNLCRAYDQIIVVVPRKVLPKYRAYHDGQKVFVLTAKQAKEHVLEWYK